MCLLVLLLDSVVTLGDLVPQWALDAREGLDANHDDRDEDEEADEEGGYEPGSQKLVARENAAGGRGPVADAAGYRRRAFREGQRRRAGVYDEVVRERRGQGL